jgi:hypothetical protein
VPLKGGAKIEQLRSLARASIAKWLCKQKLNCLLLSMCRARGMQRRERKSSGAAINSSHGNKSALGRCKKTLIARVRYKRSQPEKHLFGPNLEQ